MCAIPIEIYSALTIIILVVYKGSASVPAFAGTHAPGRAGRHFDLFDSIFDRE